MKIKRATKRTLARQLNELRRQYIEARRRGYSAKAYMLRVYIANHAAMLKDCPNG